MHETGTKEGEETFWVDGCDSSRNEDMAGSVTSHGDCTEEGTFGGILVDTLADSDPWLQRHHAEKPFSPDTALHPLCG